MEVDPISGPPLEDFDDRSIDLGRVDSSQTRDGFHGFRVETAVDLQRVEFVAPRPERQFVAHATIMPSTEDRGVSTDPFWEERLSSVS
ncbi:hypothetical protein AUV07_09800 [Microbacterium sp. CH1]|nr:hypothetical protein AUV07_09800 [Microbacterium sp. CH1]